jgi:nitroimidazol reductase NimA-like FMN-containing flavoprotein (pyridoxamine 5'-phosphate oxidase superfamily)
VRNPPARNDGARAVLELERQEAMRLLGSVSYGRIVFTRDALPAIHPVNHIIDDGEVIIRTRLTAKISFTVRSAQGVVVAYEADEIDPIRHLGWSVVVTGVARTVTNPQRLTRCKGLLRPWVNGAMDTVIAIEPGIVTGIQLTDDQR